ncbi:MAG: ATP-binding protein [Myxococcota bacterium]
MHWVAQQLNPTRYSTIIPHNHEPPTRHPNTLKQLVSELDNPHSKVLVVGAPGVGKTTLLYALAGQAQALGRKKVVLIQTDRIRQLAPAGSSESTYAQLLRQAMDYWMTKLHGEVVFAIDDVHRVLRSNGRRDAFLFTALQSRAQIVITTTDAAYRKLLRLRMNHATARPRYVMMGVPAYG